MIELKDYYELKGINGFIQNAKMYDLKSSLISSGFPMRPKVDYTESTEKLLNRMARLCNHPIGAGENNFLKGVIVNFDIVLPIKVWTEWERYVHSPIVSSSSTMHKIMKFELNSFSEDTDESVIRFWEQLREEYNSNPTKENYLRVLHSTPVGLKLTARVTCSMMSLRNMYFQRRNHRLSEWRKFCEWMYNELPYFKVLAGIKEEMMKDDK